MDRYIFKGPGRIVYNPHQPFGKTMLITYQAGWGKQSSFHYKEAYVWIKTQCVKYAVKRLITHGTTRFPGKKSGMKELQFYVEIH